MHTDTISPPQPSAKLPEVALRRCDCCGRPTPVSLLDSKPGPGHFTIAELNQASDEGRPFDRLECEDCYGPGWVASVPACLLDGLHLDDGRGMCRFGCDTITRASA